MYMCLNVFNDDALTTKRCLIRHLIQQVPYDETKDVLLEYICDIFDLSQPVRRAHQWKVHGFHSIQ